MHRMTILLAVALLPIATSAYAGKAGSFTTRRDKTYSYQSQAGGGMASGSFTGPRGNTTQGDVTGSYAGGGDYDVNGTVTGPAGGTHSGSAVVDPN